jgi:Xaa-Pro aminopeptidase
VDLDFFLKNRRNISNRLEDKSVMVLFAGKAPYKRGDELYAFTPDRNFYYVTGIDSDSCIVLLYKNNGDVLETLYIQRSNGYLYKWVGANMTEDEAKEKSGVEDIRYIDQFENDLASIVFKYRVEKLYLDLEKRQWDVDHSPAVNFAKKFTSKYPYILLKDIYPEFSKLRSVKTSQEVDCIRKAIAITQEGIELMLKNTTAGMMEYEIEAYFDYVMTKNGVRDKAFATIAASGKNATVLHYTSNHSKTSENDLILFDLGAQYKYYNADISRTYPVNGKFTARQKQLYNIVLEGQRVAIENMRPGLPFTKPNEALKQYYAQELKKIGLIKQDSELEQYYYHSVGHMLGLETHDIGRHNEGNLLAGMVITVEPGLYIEEEGIGIRIEDDILITEDGCENLSKSIIKTVDELEAFMH